MNPTSKKNVLIGLTVVVSICILYWGIEYLKGINLLKPANFYYAKFEKVNGLTVASPVTVNGFKVGQVREITYDYDTNQISVELSFEKGLKIPDGSTITFSNELLGAAALQLNLGASKTYMEVGSVIPTQMHVGEWLDNYVEEPEQEEEVKVYDETAEDPDKITITRNDAGDFIVHGKAIEKLVIMTNFNNDEAVRRFQYIWRIKGIDEKLKERGIKEGQTVHIGEMEFEYRE